MALTPGPDPHAGSDGTRESSNFGAVLTIAVALDQPGTMRSLKEGDGRVADWEKVADIGVDAGIV
jgi:2-methylcitrate dehydratase PrpD